MSKRTMLYRNVLLAPLAALAFSLGGAHTMYGGDACNNVKITLSNKTSGEIKVTTFEYYDYDKDKWRTEHMFGLDGYQKLEAGRGLTWTRDLEYVNNDNTKFKVTYQHRIGGTKWGTDQYTTTGEFKCTDGLTKSVSLTQ